MRLAPLGVPLSVPRFAPQAIQAFVPEVSQSAAVTVTANATPHTVGAWMELIASNGAETQWLGVTALNTSASGTDTAALLDIGIGAGGSEVVVVASLPVGFANTTPGYFHLVPLRIAKGARVAARMRATITADTASIIATTLGGPTPFRSPSKLVTMGADTAASRGTNMPTTDTYVEITATTSEPFAGLVICGAMGGAGGVSGEAVVFTVGAGAAGSEVAIGTATFSCGSAENIARAAVGQLSQAQPMVGVVGRHIPAGSRLACKQSIGRTYRDAILFGVPYA